MSGALLPSQEKHYQKPTPLPPRLPEAAKIQDDRSVTPEIISIKIAEGKDRFQASAFLEIPVLLPMWQC